MRVCGCACVRVRAGVHPGICGVQFYCTFGFRERHSLDFRRSNGCMRPHLGSGGQMLSRRRGQASAATTRRGHRGRRGQLLATLASREAVQCLAASASGNGLRPTKERLNYL